MKKFLLLPLLASLVLSSCEKVLEVDEYEAQRLVVVNAVPSNGQQLFVNLSYSHFFLDTLAAHPIDGATMSVSVNGMRYMPSAVEGCNYFFPCIMSDGDVLSLEASVKGTTITAQTVVPPMPALNNLTAQVDTSTAFTFCRIAFDLADHEGVPEYYHFMVSCHDSGQRYNPYEDRIEDIDTLVTKLFLCADRKLTASGVSALEPMAGYFYNRLLCSDSLIDGSNHHAELLLIMLKDTNEIQPFKHEYVLNVESVSPERYQYLHDVSAITGMSQMFSEPAEIYSNVKGAYGIFGANARLFLPLTLDTLHSPSTAVPPIIRSVGIPPVGLSLPYVK